jgi:hypothetical protein
MVDALVPALITGAVGVVGATSVERARWRRTAAASAAERELVTQRGLRLVEREFHEAEMRITRAARIGFFLAADRRLATDEWHAHRAELAAVLGATDWHRVIAAYDAIVDLNETLDERLGAVAESTPENVGQAITSAVFEARLSQVRDTDQLESRWRAIRTASWILRAYVGDSGKAERAIDEDERMAAELWPRQTEHVAPRVDSAAL